MTDILSPQERQVYTEKLHKKIQAWEAALLDLEERGLAAAEMPLENFEDEVAALKARLRAFQLRTEALGSAGEADWAKLSEGMDEAWEDMQAALQQARTEFEQIFADEKSGELEKPPG